VQRECEVPAKVLKAVEWASQFDPYLSGLVHRPDNARLELLRADAFHCLRGVQDPDNLVQLLNLALAEFPLREGYPRIPALEAAEERGIKFLLQTWREGPTV